MKKIFSLAVALIASVSMFAQSEVGSFSVTPKVGINLATVTGSGDQKMKVGIAAGAEAAYQATDAFAVSLGAMYSAQGCKIDEVKLNQNYLNIPILANYYVTKGLAIKAGVQPAFLLSAKAKGNGGEEDMKDRCKSFDFSIPVGLSYEISNVVIDARYNIGLTQIQKKIEFEGESKSKNSVFQITVGYKF